MSKKCVLLWRDAHSEGKTLKTHQVGTTLDVEASFPSQKDKFNAAVIVKDLND